MKVFVEAGAPEDDIDGHRTIMDEGQDACLGNKSLVERHASIDAFGSQRDEDLAWIVTTRNDRHVDISRHSSAAAKDGRLRTKQIPVDTELPKRAS